MEGWLTAWLTLRGPIPDKFSRPDQEDVFRILEKIGGNGYSRVCNLYINSTNFHTRIMAVRDSLRRPDWETISHLICLSLKDDVHQAGPIDQSYAAFGLAATGRHREAIEAVVRWGLRTLVSVVDQLAESPIDDEALTPAFDALEQEGDALPGGILALGTARQSKRQTEIVDRIRSILRTASAESDAASACIIALRMLGDRSDETVQVVAPHLRVERNYREALQILTSAQSDIANQVLLESLGRCFDEDLAIYLLQRGRGVDGVVQIIKAVIERSSEIERVSLLTTLILRVEDPNVLQQFMDDATAKNTRNRSPWIGKNSAAAVQAIL